MLGPLTAVLETPEFQEWGCAYAVAIRHVDDDTIVDLRVDDGEGATNEPNWRVHCLDRWRFWVDDDQHDIYVVEPDKPLARQFTDDQQMLFFSKAPSRPDAVVAELVAVHTELAGSEISFQKYFSMPLQTLIEGRFGQLAHGPAFLVDAYAGVLRRHNMGESVVSKGPMRLWRDGEFCLASSELRLACLGGSLVLARAFTSERIAHAAA
jgi:hypothetical protein